MNAGRRPAALIGVLLAVAGGGALVGSAALAGDRPPSTIGVRNGDSEFSFSLSRTKVDPGPAILQYQNTGMDPHDLKIQRKGDDEVLEIGRKEPGEVGTLNIDRLKPDSKYLLWCSLEGHAEAGMEASLKVGKKRGRN